MIPASISVACTQAPCCISVKISRYPKSVIYRTAVITPARSGTGSCSTTQKPIVSVTSVATAATGRSGSSHYPEEQIQFAGIDDSKIARQGFGRGLCPLSDRFIAGGSSPSTISVYDLYSSKMVVSVNLSMDIRNAIHGLEIWPHA